MYNIKQFDIKPINIETLKREGYKHITFSSLSFLREVLKKKEMNKLIRFNGKYFLKATL